MSNLDMSAIPLADTVARLHESGFIIYCGAGISIPAPTCAPNWWTLTEEILYGFFDRVPDEWGLPNDLIVKNDDLAPEAVFENFSKILDTGLYTVFKALDVGQPNANHQLIARLAKIGVLKACFTTNFDVYIERALKEEGVEYTLLVNNTEYLDYTRKLEAGELNTTDVKFLLCKIHGTIERPDSIVSVASAYKTSKGFSQAKAEVLTGLLGNYPVLFLGYSGWDFEHTNYRRYWERVGKSLKSIYWSRRIGETGGQTSKKYFKLQRTDLRFVKRICL